MKGENIPEHLAHELRRIRAEKAVIKAVILAKYYNLGARSLEDLLHLVEEDRVSDTQAHDDLVRLDHLEHRENKIKQLLTQLQQEA